MADPYSVLGVSRTASQSEIKSAYRRLARKYHPDVNSDPAAAREFSRVSEAYHILIDPKRRDLYDRLGSTGASRRTASDSAAARAARRAYYQARVDRIVNEWLEREREEARARGQAVYTTVTLFLSTFMVAMLKPSILGISNPYLRAVLILLFAISVWHLFTSLKHHFDRYTYRASVVSITRPLRPDKPFKRSVAWTFVIGGYMLSLGTGMLLGMLTEDFTSQFFGQTHLLDLFFAVFFYPPIAVLIVDMMYLVNLRLDEW